MSLPKPNRLQRRQDFDRVYKKGLRRSSTHLTLRAFSYSHPPDVLPASRVGVAVSQKVSKRAVVRNRIKRCIHRAMRQLLPQFRRNWDLVIAVKPSAAQCEYEHFLQELKQLLIEAEVIHGS